MNKKIKGLIAFGLTVGALTAFNMCGGINAAYAASDDADEITSLTIEQTDGDEIDLYTDKDYDDELEDDMEEGETYYGESETKKITIDLDDDIDEDYVRIFIGSKEYEVGDKIPLSTTGTTTIKVRVYEEEYDEDENYRSSEYNQYILKIKYDDGDIDELEEIEIQDSKGNNLNVYTDEDYKNKLTDDLEESETYYVKTSTKKISIDADVDDDYIRIFKGSDDYELGDEISLSSGVNTLKVRIYEDEYDEDEDYSSSDYVQYIFKVNYNSSTNSEVYTNDTVDSDKTSLTGNPQTPDQDFTIIPSNSDNYSYGWKYMNGVWYYQEPNGSYATGWKLIDGNWYYMDSYGIMQTGWKFINGAWYYLESSGKMHTGWIKVDGLWYYLYTNGTMASNTWIDGYRLGSNGAWVR